ncbi:MAG TPA: Xaa-Pro peptidase family protein [Symbiobacteriaceae bacterium]|nr:Xaa-Pro peptidase family protein [Symbiobacteriaceae bacterium]
MSSVQRLLAKMQTTDLEAFLLIKHETVTKENVRYVSGFTGTSAYLLITPDRRVLLTDDRYVQQATAQCPEFEVIDHNRAWPQALAKQVQDMGIRRLGFEARGLTVDLLDTVRQALPEVELVSTVNVVEQLRAIKEPEEVEKLARACQIADQTFAHVVRTIRAGVTERDIALEFECQARRLGALSLAFDLIVVSGLRGSFQHGKPTEKVVAPGDFITMDFGALYDGYLSDCTRTVVIGTATPRQRDVYNAVRRAQAAGLAAIRAGTRGTDVFAAVWQEIEAAGYSQWGGRGIGHGVGLEIHEEPYLQPQGDMVLQAGHVVTMEPGIYIPDWGGVRIEDMVVVTPEGCRVLTGATKELLEL